MLQLSSDRLGDTFQDAHQSAQRLGGDFPFVQEHAYRMNEHGSSFVDSSAAPRNFIKNRH